MKVLPSHHKALGLECGSMIAHNGNLYFNGKFIKFYQGTHMFRNEVWFIPKEGLAKVEEINDPDMEYDGKTHWYLFVENTDPSLTVRYNNEDNKVRFLVYELETELEIAQYAAEYGYFINFEAMVGAAQDSNNEA